MSKVGISLALPAYILAQQPIIQTTTHASVLIANILAQLAVVRLLIAPVAVSAFLASALEAASSIALMEPILTLQQLHAIPVLILALLVNSAETTVQAVQRHYFSTRTAHAYRLVTLLMPKILPPTLVKSVNILVEHAKHHQLTALPALLAIYKETDVSVLAQLGLTMTFNLSSVWHVQQIAVLAFPSYNVQVVLLTITTVLA